MAGAVTVAELSEYAAAIEDAAGAYSGSPLGMQLSAFASALNAQ